MGTVIKNKKDSAQDKFMIAMKNLFKALEMEERNARKSK